MIIFIYVSIKAILFFLKRRKEGRALSVHHDFLKRIIGKKKLSKWYVNKEESAE